MRKVMSAWLSPDMVLAKDAYHDDQLILPKGYRLTKKAIARLNRSSVPFVFIEEEQPESAEFPTEETLAYADRIKESADFQNFSMKFSKNVQRFNSVITAALDKNLPPNMDILLQDTLSLLKYTHGSISLFDMLHYIPQSSDPTCAHSIQVAMVCHELAVWSNMSQEDTLLATQCGLLHDIGKFKSTPDTIANHHVLGYAILRKYNMNPHISNAALMHHEQCDGSGAPLGLTADKIDTFAKMISMANAYVSMISPQTHQKEVCPFDIIRKFEANGIQKYDSLYISILLNKIYDTYKSCKVRLSDGRCGVISFTNKFNLSRPIVQCGSDYIDLSQIPSLAIEKLL